MEQDFQAIYERTRNMIGKYAKENPELMTAFSKVHHLGSGNGVLNSKSKELIALGISIHAKCEGCITMHIHDAIEKGATREEIIETIGVSIYMGGGPSVVHGAIAFAALNEFETAEKVQKIINAN